MAETMIERVAMAIRADLGLDWPYTGHKEMVDTARAAIAAMREPTDAMLGAGKCTHGHWVRMIDAALSEGE